ncbi:hypothetical protein EDB89DRAFT_2073548 [Lactarius sanguifluus]|nr:hypothetical protein EDB89DRAFT_2073548 [Lactarius sanguifluus]
MSADDTQGRSFGPQQQWAGLRPQQPSYVYPGSQPTEEESSLQTAVSVSHDHSPDVPSFGYGPSYNQISRSSSLLPSSGQYSRPDTAQLQYPSYPNPSYSDSQQPRHNYFPTSQNSFDPAISTMANPPYGTPTVSDTYTSSPFPHQFPELRPAHSYSAGSSLPAVTSLDALAPTISTFDAPRHHTPTSTVSNKRQRPEDQDQEGDVNSQARGDTALSLAEKLKRACARCRGLKVRCHFRDDRDTCDRCIKASQECIIPGRKQRRPPPKRELLLAKIRDQATRIKELMAQLEATQMADKNVMQLTANLPTEFARSSTLGSPASGSFVDSSGYVDVSSPFDSASSFGAAHSNISQENSEWIAKARENLEAFGDFIRLGGSSTARSDLVDQDLEDSSSSDDGHLIDGDSSGSEDELDVDRLSPEIRGTVRERTLSGKGSPSGRAKMVGLPAQASPFGMMATLSVRNIKPKGSASVISDVSDLGVANEDFFRMPTDPLGLPGHQTPPLLRKNIITPAEAEKLFKIYFDWMNPSTSLLDPKLYTAQQVYWRCPFLFTVICAVASRYDSERPDLYPTAMEYARQEAGATFLGGQKRVEVVQAYYLLSLYPVPMRRWEDDRSWIYLGQAIRVAMDMNLHHPNTAKPQNELHAREMLNRTRAWLNCFNLDRSYGSQYGKMAIINNEDYVANRSYEWWNSSEHNMEHFDIHLCAYTSELRVLNDFLSMVYSNPEHPTGLNKEIDLGKLASDTDDKIEQLRLRWFDMLEKTNIDEPQNRFRIGLLKLGYSYARLVALAFGFQHAFGKSNTDENPFLIRCIRAAEDVVNAMVDDVGIPSQRIYVRHGPESQTVFVAFSCTFLIKLLQPKYASYISPEQRAEIVRTVGRAVEFLGAPDIGVDDRHGPRLYSRFIGGLLERVKTPPATSYRPSRSKRKSPGFSATGHRVNLTPPVARPATPTTNYFEPLPKRTTTPFDHFAFPTESDPSALTTTTALGLTASEFFYAPLPFDNDLLESMQTLSSLSEMDDTMLPGFGWMKQMPPVDYAQYQQMAGVYYS